MVFVVLCCDVFGLVFWLKRNPSGHIKLTDDRHKGIGVSIQHSSFVALRMGNEKKSRLSVQKISLIPVNLYEQLMKSSYQI